MADRHIGKFQISFDLISEHPELARTILSKVLVMRAEAQYDRAAIKYVALGDVFSEVPPEAQAPWYDVFISKDVEPQIEFRPRLGGRA